jgi:ASC-1-like (ASCH) protein
MSTVACDVHHKYFQQLVSGEKTYEGRVRKEKWQSISVGDLLVVSNLDKPEQKASFRVVSLEFANDFKELYEKLTTRLLPDYSPYTSAEALYGSIYTEAQIKEHGVVGVGLEIV